MSKFSNTIAEMIVKLTRIMKQKTMYVVGRSVVSKASVDSGVHMQYKESVKALQNYSSTHYVIYTITTKCIPQSNSPRAA